MSFAEVVSPPEQICDDVRHDLTRYVEGCAPGQFDPEMPDASLCCILDLMETVVDWMFVILLIMAAIWIIWGAFMFLTSGGSPEKLNTARNKLIWALVGVAVAFGA